MAIGTTYGRWAGDVIREDVLDEIYQITPEDTPFFNMVGDSVSKDPLHQWPIRSLTTRQHNAVQEGAEYGDGSYADMILPSRVSNICQIMTKLPKVNGTMLAVNVIGIGDLMADQIQQRSVEFKTDIEHALLRGSLNSGSSADATARRMGGYFNVIATNSSDLGSLATITENGLNSLFQDIWEDGGRAQDILVNGHYKRVLSGFSGGSTKFMMTEDRKIIRTVGIYESDFHTTMIHLCRDVPQGDGTHALFAFDRSFFSKAWLRTPRIERMPKTGDSFKASILAELTLEFGNVNAAGKYFNAQNAT